MSLRFTYPACSRLSATRICNAGEMPSDKDQLSFCKRRAFAALQIALHFQVHLQRGLALQRCTLHPL